MVNRSTNGVYLLIGEEEFLKEEALNRIKSAMLSEENKEFNYDSFYGKDVDARRIIDSAATLPLNFSLFSEGEKQSGVKKKRLVVVKDVDKLSSYDKDLLINYLKHPSEFSCLVLETGQTNTNDAFLSSLSKYAKVIFCKSLYDNEIPAWICKQVKGKNKTIEDTALEILQESVGNDLRLLVNAIEILALYVGGEEEITKDDVERLIGRSEVKTTYELADAIGKKKTREALTILQSLGRDGRKATQILGLIAWHFRRIWKAKDLLDRGKSEERLSQELRIPKFFLPGFLRQIDNFPREREKEVFRLLLEADSDIKTGRKKPEIALELLVIKLCNSPLF